MPLRGYHRVGGPNATLTELGFGGHGTPSQQYPAYGTLLESGLVSNNYITIQETSDVIGNGVRHYSTYANGLGGSYEQTDYYEYLAYGTRLGSAEWGNEPQYQLWVIDGQDWYFENGKSTALWAYSDGSGGYYGEGVTLGSFYGENVQVQGAPIFNINSLTTYFGATDQYIQNGKYSYDAPIWDGMGGISNSSGSAFVGGNFYPDTTYIMDAPDSSVEVPYGSGNYYFDGNDNRWEWDGNGNIVLRYSGLYASGTFITNYQDYNYYWDGTGSYYQGEYTGSGESGGQGGGGGPPAYGTATGNTSAGATYININGGDYQNGEYYSVEYNDGSGGFYWDTSYNYYPFGTLILSYYDTNYYSDGYGNYYT